MTGFRKFRVSDPAYRGTLNQDELGDAISHYIAHRYGLAPVRTETLGEVLEATPALSNLEDFVIGGKYRPSSGEDDGEWFAIDVAKNTGDGWDNDKIMVFRDPELRDRILKMLIRMDCEAQDDHPDDDATDAAHPAWWRGHDRGTEAVCAILVNVLNDVEGSKTAKYGYEKLQRVVDRVTAIMARNSELETRIAWVEDESKKIAEENIKLNNVMFGIRIALEEE